MTYRGIVSNGVVVIDGDKLVDGTVVDVTPHGESRQPNGTFVNHPALGIWRDRTDLPQDSIQASKALRQKLMRRVDE